MLGTIRVKAQWDKQISTTWGTSFHHHLLHHHHLPLSVSLAGGHVKPSGVGATSQLTLLIWWPNKQYECQVNKQYECQVNKEYVKEINSMNVK